MRQKRNGNENEENKDRIDQEDYMEMERVMRRSEKERVGYDLKKRNRSERV